MSKKISSKKFDLNCFNVVVEHDRHNNYNGCIHRIFILKHNSNFLFFVLLYILHLTCAYVFIYMLVLGGRHNDS